jgi:outer membrane protein TolC
MAAHAQSLSLTKTLELAESTNPAVFAQRMQVSAAHEELRASRSTYLPSLDLSGVALDGSPGGFAIEDVGNNLSASQRIGTGGGVILKQTIWDFGRTDALVEKSKANQTVQEKRVALSRVGVDLEVLRTYFYCAFYHAEIKSATEIADEARYVAKETNKFVQAGQRSIVERYLVDAQTKQAETRVAELQKRQEEIRTRLGAELAMGSRVDCQTLGQQSAEIAALEKSPQKNPLIEISAATVKMAEQDYEASQAERRPNLVAIATGGYFDGNNLDQKWNYGAGLGVTIPLFEGFRLEANVNRAAALKQSAQEEKKSTELGVVEQNSRFLEARNGLGVRMSSLKLELDLAQKAFKFAQKRYFSGQGSLIDLREALRNLSRVETSINETQRDLYIARTSQVVYNGGRN